MPQRTWRLGATQGFQRCLSLERFCKRYSRLVYLLCWRLRHNYLPRAGGPGAGEHHFTLLPARATTSATTTVSISTATTTRTPVLSRSGLVYRYSSSGEFLAVECFDSGLCFCTGWHFNKAEPLRAACVAILDQ